MACPSTTSKKGETMQFPDWLIEALQNNKRVIAFINPVDYNDKNISVIKNRIINDVGNASKVYIYLEFQEVSNIEQNRIVFAIADDIDLNYEQEKDFLKIEDKRRIQV